MPVWGEEASKNTICDIMELTKRFTERMYEECVREILCTVTYMYF